MNHMPMKTKVLALTVLALLGALTGCQKEVPGDFGYSYPREVKGDKAVWWEEKEWRICEAPIVDETSKETTRDCGTYTVRINVADTFYAGIGTYFKAIEEAGFTLNPYYDCSSLQEWESAQNPTQPLFADFIQQDGPHGDPERPFYHTTYTIRLTGKMYKNNKTYFPILEIIYTYSQDID